MQTVNIKVIPNAKKNEVCRDEDGRVRVYVKAPAARGRANKELIEVLAGYFKVKKSKVSIVRGAKSREKVVGIG